MPTWDWNFLIYKEALLLFQEYKAFIGQWHVTADRA